MGGSAMDPNVERPAVRPRKVRFSYDELPRHWFANDPIATHLANGLHLLFPAGERYFVRSVRHYLPLFEHDPILREEIRGFSAQEGSHSREHERVAEILEAQGYEIRPFLEKFERMFALLEPRLPPALNLASTAACEHFTAMFAEHAFTDEFREAHAHEGIRQLLMWHAAEEIEHKAVAFDVLTRVNDSWLLRAAGMTLATFVLLSAWSAGTHMLLAQDGFTFAQIRAGLRKVRASSGRDARKDVFLKGFFEYLRPGFHPWQKDNREMVAAFLAELEATKAA
ncbi:MAG: metal-dependent hydrolase [Polyangiaceae bacterium]|nr:metal-dependent hydrolase [Polyangiaceae bacterium]